MPEDVNETGIPTESSETPSPALGDAGQSSMQGALEQAREDQTALDREAKADAEALETQHVPRTSEVLTQDSQLPQEEQAVEALRSVDGLQPDQWENLNESARLGKLQESENSLAGVQERKALDVIPVDMGQNEAGYYDGNAIYINRNDLGEKGVRDNLGTVIHEGRHAYQDQAIDHPGLHPDAAQVEAWRDNKKPGHYIRPDKDLGAYFTQPIEADAYQYENSVLENLYKNT